MIVKSITIGGFKNIKKTKICLGKLIVLASPNNYGKSNTLEAIDFGVDFLSASRKMRKAMMSWVKGIPLITDLAHNDYTFEIEIDDPSLGDYRYIRYGYRFSWFKDDGTGQRVTDEWLEARKSESVRYSSFIKRNEGKYRKGYSTQAYRKVTLDSSQLAIDVLASIDDIEILHVIKAIQNIRYQVCSSLDLQDRFAPPPFEFVNSQDESSIGFDDEDIPKALFQLKKGYPQKYELFKDALFTLFPEFSEISLQSFELKGETAGEIDVYITRPGLDHKAVPDEDIPFKIKEELYRLIIKSDFLNQPINASQVSTGTKRIIWLLASVFISSCRGISFIGIEELETSIHPKLLKSLLEILIESQENTCIIASSHSPFLVQYLKPTQIYLGIPNNGAATFRRIAETKSKSLVQEARNLGVSTGEYLFELMAGESESIEILNQYVEESVYE